MLQRTIPSGDLCARKLTRADSREYYQLRTMQYTVVPTDGHSLEDILNDYGLKLLRETQNKYDNEDYKDTYNEYTIINTGSGHWFPDTNSIYHKESDTTSLDTTDNLIMLGFPSKRPRNYMHTSILLLVTDDWVLTKNKSLYKLGTKNIH